MPLPTGAGAGVASAGGLAAGVALVVSGAGVAAVFVTCTGKVAEPPTSREPKFSAVGEKVGNYGAIAVAEYGSGLRPMA